jgi:hypothetical protein
VDSLVNVEGGGRRRLVKGVTGLGLKIRRICGFGIDRNQESKSKGSRDV